MAPQCIPTNMPISDNLFELVKSEDKVLDVGCGVGRLCADFLKRNCQYYGVDINESAIEEAKKIYPSATFSVQNTTKLSFTDSFFDVVVCQGVLACMDFSDRMSAANQIHRITKSGGILHVTELDRSSDEKYYADESKITGELGTVARRQDRTMIGYHTHHFLFSELKQLFPESNWEVIREEHPSILTKNKREYPSHRLIYRKK